jgi:hypothetical protein
VARRTGNPGLTSGALATLARVLVHAEPHESRALIAESMELNDALGDIIVNENALVMAITVSAELGQGEQVLRLTARALDHGLSMLVGNCSCLEAGAEALAPAMPDVAVVLHGAIDVLVPGLAHAEPQATFRSRATAATSPQLDATQIDELRARGATMSEVQATAYARDAIRRILSDKDRYPLQPPQTRVM